MSRDNLINTKKTNYLTNSFDNYNIFNIRRNNSKLVKLCCVELLAILTNVSTIARVFKYTIRSRSRTRSKLQYNTICI